MFKAKRDPPPFVMWEYENHIYLVEMYKKIMGGTKKNVYQLGTYSKFVRFVYEKKFNI